MRSKVVQYYCTEGVGCSCAYINESLLTVLNVNMATEANTIYVSVFKIKKRER